MYIWLTWLGISWKSKEYYYNSILGEIVSLHTFLKVSCLAWQWMLHLTFETAEKGALLLQATYMYTRTPSIMAFITPGSIQHSLMKGTSFRVSLAHHMSYSWCNNYCSTLEKTKPHRQLFPNINVTGFQRNITWIF